MNVENKRLLYYIIVGALITAIMAFLVHEQNQSKFEELMACVIIFGIALSNMVIINEQVNSYNQKLLKIYVFAYTYKGMIITFTGLIEFVNNRRIMDFFCMEIQLIVIDAIACMSCFYVYFNDKKKINDFLMTTLGWLSSVALCIRFSQLHHSHGLDKNAVLMADLILSLTPFIGIVLSQKRFNIKKLPNECYLMCLFLIFRSSEHFMKVLSILHPSKHFIYKPLVIMHFLEIYTLALTIYETCFISPLNEKKDTIIKADKQIESNAANRELIINLSHELKTPINVIRSALELLRYDIKEKEIQYYINEIQKHSNLTMKIIRLMIDNHKLASGNIHPKFQVYNVVELVEDVVDAFAEAYPKYSFIFNPIEEEIYVKLDLELVKNVTIYSILELIKYHKSIDGMKDEIYLELNISEDGKEVQTITYLPTSLPLEKLIFENTIEDAHDYIIEELVAKYIKYVIMLHKGTYKLEKQKGRNKSIGTLPGIIENVDESEIMFIDEAYKTKIADEIHVNLIY